MRLIRESYVLVWYLSLHASFYILFSHELVFFFYALCDNDVTRLPWRHAFLDRFQWNLHSICKIGNKNIFPSPFFDSRNIFWENYIYCAVTCPIPFGPPIILVSSTRNSLIPWYTSFTYLRIGVLLVHVAP